jgi:D-3-phosphoglycerate dehydrogenase
VPNGRGSDCSGKGRGYSDGSICSEARKLCPLNRAVKVDTWDYKIIKPVQRLKGKIVGLIGFGRIGRMVTRKLTGFQFHTVVYDPYVDQGIADDYGVEFVDFETVVAESEFISLHVPRNAETKYMLDANVFRKME